MKNSFWIMAAVLISGASSYAQEVNELTFNLEQEDAIYDRENQSFFDYCQGLKNQANEAKAKIEANLKLESAAFAVKSDYIKTDTGSFENSQTIRTCSFTISAKNSNVKLLKHESQVIRHVPQSEQVLTCGNAIQKEVKSSETVLLAVPVQGVIRTHCRIYWIEIKI